MSILGRLFAKRTLQRSGPGPKQAPRGLCLELLEDRALLALTDLNFGDAFRAGSIGVESGAAITTDEAGNVYVSGRCEGTVDFDPGAAVANRSGDAFVAKYTSSGELVWAQTFLGAVNEAGGDIAVDGAGNVYVTGSFQGTADFDPGEGIANLSSPFSRSAFVLKLTSSGSFAWARRYGGTADCDAMGIKVDEGGNVYTTGMFQGTIDFDPGAGTANRVSAGQRDVYLAKLNSAGTFVWAQRFGGSGDETAGDLALDTAGNIYATGSFQGTADFDPGAGTTNLTCEGVRAAYVARFATSGSLVWARQLGGPADAVGRGIAVDAEGGVYTAGDFFGEEDFDPGVAVVNLTSTGGRDAFVSKLSGSGDFTWARQLGGTNDDLAAGIALDEGGNVFLVGSFQGSGDFDSSGGVWPLAAAGISDAFVARMAGSTGAFVWAGALGGNNEDQGLAIALDQQGSLYCSGYFRDTADFDPGPAIANLTSAGQDDLFVSHLTYNAGIVQVTINQSAGQPDPTNQAAIHFTVSFNEPVVDFATGDVSLGGTVSGTLVATVSPADVEGRVYDVEVTGMSGAGTVIAQLSAGVASTGDGRTNRASTSTDNQVLFDSLSPIAGLSDPTNGGVVRAVAINARGFLDVTFADAGGSGSDLATIMDNDAEFTLSGQAAGGVVVAGQPEFVSGNTYRYTFTGEFGFGHVGVEFIAASFFDQAGNPNAAGSAGFEVVDVPKLSIDSPSIIEGNSGKVNVVFTVTLSHVSDQTITVAYATANQSASAGSDYTAQSGLVTFAPGVVTQTIAVPVTGDLAVEADETFLVNLSNPINAGLDVATGIGTILNNDPTLSINDVKISEGAGATATATFTVSLSAASPQDIEVDYYTQDGTAMAGADFTAIPAASPLTLTIPAGQKKGTFTVTVLGDSLDEASETFFVKLANARGAFISDDSGTGTIIDTDPPPKLSLDDVVVDESAGNATFRVSLSTPSGQNARVNFATAKGTALAGVDYTAVLPTALVIPAGELFGTFTVPILNDLIDENDETFKVKLSRPIGATILRGTATGRIIDNDDPPTVSIADAMVTEGDSRTSNITFTVSLSVASAKTVTVPYTTSEAVAGDSATVGLDFKSKSGTLTFKPGVMSQTISVLVVGDKNDELDESFLVTLLGPTNATLGQATGVGTIVDNDGPPTLSINNAGVIEDDILGNGRTAQFTVSLSAASGFPVTVDFNTFDENSALAGVDYIAKTDTLLFEPGETVQMVSVAMLGDFLDEPNETYQVHLSNPTNATLLRAHGIGTITDNDATPTLSINDVSLVEGDSGDKDFVFTVSLSAVSEQDVQFKYSTANGTANSVDYAPLPSTTLTIPAGELTATITVSVHGDTAGEANETFFVKLATPINAMLQKSSGKGTIINDDPAPGVVIVEVIGGGYVTDNQHQIDTRIGDNVASYVPDSFPILTAFTASGSINFAAEWSDGTSGANCFLINSQFRNGLRLVVFMNGFFLQADASAVPNAGAPGPEPDDSALAGLFRHSIDAWIASGLSDAASARLRGMSIEVADLPGRVLGYVSHNTVLIDRNAAGFGWFVDATPWASEEFALDSENSLRALATGPAAGRIDLLTVLAHELGHALGLDDLEPQPHLDELMAATLVPGLRRLPSSDEVEAIFASGLWN